MELRLREPATIDFAAGQFVSFHIAIPSFPYLRTRAYSITSPPSQSSSIRLLFNLVPGGRGSEFLYTLVPGDEVQFKGPAGTFVSREA